MIDKPDEYTEDEEASEEDLKSVGCAGLTALSLIIAIMLGICYFAYILYEG